MPEGQQAHPGEPCQRVTSDDVPALLRRWRREVARRGGITVVKLGLVTLGLGLVAHAFSQHATFPISALPWAAFALWIMGASVITAGAFTAPVSPQALTESQREVLESIGALTDVRAIGPLTAALHGTAATTGAAYSLGGLISETIVSTLVRLMAELDPKDAALIASIRSRLIRCITPPIWTPELVIASLRVLQQDTAPEILVRVAYLIARDAPTKAHQQMREEARRQFAGMLARADFGGPARLTHWIQSLPLQNATPMEWAQFITPRLALEQMLPNITVAQFLTLDPSIRQRLYRSLPLSQWNPTPINGEISRLGPGYAPMVLDLAERARDREAIPTVRLVAESHPSAVVREAARRCLPTFEEMARKEQVGRTLLRASSGPSDAESHLLRPAATSSPTEPQELLRADLGNPGRD